MNPNDADGMANSVDPDQTAPLGAVWPGSALFAQAYLSENLGSLRYNQTYLPTCSSDQWHCALKTDKSIIMQEISLVMRKLVFRVSNQLRIKPACSADETS